MLNPTLLRVSLWGGIAGFVASLVVHVATLAGVVVSEAAFVLHLGVFVTFFPVVLGLVGLAKRNGVDPRDRGAQLALQLGVLRALPVWQKVAVGLIFVYAFVNFFLTFGNGLDPGTPPLRGFSGHWLAFYFFSAVLASYLLKAVGSAVPTAHEV